MANRTVKDATSIKGTNPQYLVEKIIRSRIYDSRYWKEECFALSAELLVDKAMELKYVGGVFGGNIKPTPFLCLVLKMLQIQPEKDIIVEFIKNEDFKHILKETSNIARIVIRLDQIKGKGVARNKHSYQLGYFKRRYVRALGAYYMRLTGTSLDCFKYLEPLLNDYRKLRCQNRQGVYELTFMDEFVDQLLREERLCDVILPRIQRRQVHEENSELEPRVSALDDDLDELAESSGEDEPPPPPPPPPARHSPPPPPAAPLPSRHHRRSRSKERVRDSGRRRDHHGEHRGDYRGDYRGDNQPDPRADYRGREHRPEHRQEHRPEHRQEHRNGRDYPADHRADHRADKRHRADEHVGHRADEHVGRDKRHRGEHEPRHERHERRERREHREHRDERRGRHRGDEERREIDEANALRAKLGLPPLRP